VIELAAAGGDTSAVRASAALAALLRPRPDQRVVPPIRLGLDLLDLALGGGLIAGELLVLGGAPGTGKTITALQAARAAVDQGRSVIYASFEHESEALLARLLAAEVGDLRRRGVGTEDGEAAARLLRDVVAGREPASALMGGHPSIARAVTRLGSVAERLLLVRATPGATDVAALERLGDDLPAGSLLVVDHLQKVHRRGSHVGPVVERLKDLALRRGWAVLAIAASSAEGLRARRMRMHHLDGAESIAYDSDVVLMLNDKHRAVTRDQAAFEGARTEALKHRSIFSIEKHRSAPARVDVEFGKDFAHFRFDPNGTPVLERLAEEG
jgi:replicative DNA helicase